METECFKIDSNWKEPKRKHTFLWSDDKVQLNNNLSIEGSLNIINDDDDNDNNNTNLINIKTVQTDPNKKTCYASISFNTQLVDKENTWLIGTGMDDYLGTPDNFGIININNGFSGIYLEPNNSNWFSLSDLRLKNIISNIDNSLDKINNIRAVYYSWKSDDSNTPQVGVIAQDVLNVFKEAVSIPKNPETQHYGVCYSNLIPLLLSGIQELHSKVSANYELVSNNNKLINNNNNLLFELKDITEINKKYIDLKYNELILILNKKINEINSINTLQQEDIDSLKKNNEEHVNNTIYNINNMHSILSNYQLLIDKHTEENNKNKSHIDKINEKYNNYDNKLDNLLMNHIKILKQQEEIYEKNDYLQSRFAHFDNLEVAFDNIVVNNDNLITETEKNNNLVMEYKLLLEKYADLIEKNNNLVEAQNKNINNLEIQINTLKEKNNTLETNLNELNNKMSEQQKLININKNKYDILQNMITNIQKKI
jgi:hypothetical protein